MEIPANELQSIAAEVPAVAIPAPGALDLAPPLGDSTPRTYSWAGFTG